MTSLTFETVRTRGSRIAGDAIVAVGKVIGLLGTCSPVLVNLSGAALACYGFALWRGEAAGLILGGAFLLAAGRQLEKRTPRAGSGRGG